MHSELISDVLSLSCCFMLFSSLTVSTKMSRLHLEGSGNFDTNSLIYPRPTELWVLTTPIELVITTIGFWLSFSIITFAKPNRYLIDGVAPLTFIIVHPLNKKQQIIKITDASPHFLYTANFPALLLLFFIG